MNYVDVCCWVGLGRVRSAYISCGLGWVTENGPTTMSVLPVLIFYVQIAVTELLPSVLQ